MREGAVVLAVENPHELENVDEVDCEDNDERDDVDLSSELDMFAGQHGRNLAAGRALVKMEFE